MDNFMLAFFDFLDWLADTWESILNTVWEAIKIAAMNLVYIFTMPLWLLPFVLWLIFVKRKGGASDG